MHFATVQELENTPGTNLMTHTHTHTTHEAALCVCVFVFGMFHDGTIKQLFLGGTSWNNSNKNLILSWSSRQSLGPWDDWFEDKLKKLWNRGDDWYVEQRSCPWPKHFTIKGKSLKNSAVTSHTKYLREGTKKSYVFIMIHPDIPPKSKDEIPTEGTQKKVCVFFSEKINEGSVKQSHKWNMGICGHLSIVQQATGKADLPW